jgi:hypothetical protein
MPRGPKGERRPADVIGNAVHVMRITPEEGKDPAAVALGRKGGKARAEGMSAKRRKEIARRAAKARWK